MIEVGEYIRTYRYGFCKVTDEGVGETDKGDVRLIELDNNEWTEIGSWIKSHSKNIIDLIEVGDIVCIKDSLYDNEYKSEVFEDYNNMLCINNFEEDEILELRKNIQDKQIELVSILTHEMYEQNCYKVGGENE